jgi:hypothetical protein
MTWHPTPGTRHLPYRLTLAFGNLIILKRLIKWSVLRKQGGEGARCSPPAMNSRGSGPGQYYYFCNLAPGA